MRVALLSDIHANEPALEVALAEALSRKADRIIIAGDLVGGGPFPQECIERIRALDDPDVIRGNVDRQVAKLAGKKKKLEKKLRKGGRKSRNKAWTAANLDDDGLEWLGSLPPSLTLTIEEVDALVIHGSPVHDCDYIYPSVTEAGLARMLSDADASPRILVAGHSHIPFVNRVGEILVINCGSVGSPVDGDPRGSFALLEVGPRRNPTAEIVRFMYPLDPIEQAIADRDVPGVHFASYQVGVRGRPRSRQKVLT